MENLPIVVLRKIFNNLTNLNEIIRCSLVCKNWRLAYETIYKPELLCLYTNNFMPLNKKLAFTNGKVTKYNSFHFTNVKFIDSEITRIHFANIKKLIIFDHGIWPREKFGEPENSLQSQLNHFKSLEYVEIKDNYFYKSKGEERVDLPNLKVLILFLDILEQEENQYVLNTPSLEVLITNSLGKFKFLFPQQLKYLIAYNIKEIQNDFVNLKCLTISNQTLKRLLNNEFFKNLSNLKFLSLVYSLFDQNFQEKLESQKWKYNLNDLKIIEDVYEDFLFDYKNWRNYIELKEQIGRWPFGYFANFNELINCKVPFNYFEENYLSIDGLDIDNVPDQSQLVAFLKKIDLSGANLNFTYGCNLDQSFFDELPSYLSISSICFYGDLFNRLTDYTFLSKLNFRTIYFTFYQLPYQVVWNMLKNPSVSSSHFYKFEQYIDFQANRAKDYSSDLEFHCSIYKKEDFNYEDEDRILINQRDVVRHIEMKLKTKFT